MSRAELSDLATCNAHRYCELAVIDPARVGAWTKLPWMLALLPCTDFMYHADAGECGPRLACPLIKACLLLPCCFQHSRAQVQLVSRTCCTWLHVFGWF
jgi:hypothetical protein